MAGNETETDTHTSSSTFVSPGYLVSSEKKEYQCWPTANKMKAKGSA